MGAKREMNEEKTINIDGNKYYEWKDIAQALTLFLIQVAHCGEYENVGLIRDYIGNFANPCFFLLAGMFVKPSKNQSFYIFLRKNISRLIIPYFLWALINAVFYSLLNNWGGADTANAALPFLLFMVPKYKFGGTLWFLVGLFTCRLAYFIIDYFTNNKFVNVLITVFISIVLVGLSTSLFPFLMESAFTRGLIWMSFYAIGRISFPYFNWINLNIFSCDNNKKSKIIFGLIYLAVTYMCAILYFKGINIIEISNSAILQEIFRNTVIGFVLSVHLIITSMFIKTKTMAYIGRHTMILCGTESMLKSLVIIPYSFGILFQPKSSLEVFIYVIFLYIFSYKIIFPLIDNNFNILNGMK